MPPLSIKIYVGSSPVCQSLYSDLLDVASLPSFADTNKINLLFTRCSMNTSWAESIFESGQEE
jgi:hypothetical protein